MKRILMPLAALAVALFATPFSAMAQSKQGYWTEPAGGDAVWKSGTGLCWRAGYWTPAMAIIAPPTAMRQRPPTFLNIK